MISIPVIARSAATKQSTHSNTDIVVETHRVGHPWIATAGSAGLAMTSNLEGRLMLSNIFR
jgi:hypothetical protein